MGSHKQLKKLVVTPTSIMKWVQLRHPSIRDALIVGRATTMNESPNRVVG